MRPEMGDFLWRFESTRDGVKFDPGTEADKAQEEVLAYRRDGGVDRAVS